MVSPHITIILSSSAQSIFEPASPQAEKILGLTYGFIIAALGILLLVVSLTVYIAIKFGKKGNNIEPRQVSGNRKLEIAMIAGPLLLVIGFFLWSVNVVSAVLPDKGLQKPDIIITGHQWWWQADYPGTKVTTANEIHLPVGKRLLLQLDAADVIHDWWVPALGGKMDMIPGRSTYLWVTITKQGVYDGACSEFCGQQHAWMRIKVFAQSPDDYKAWLNAHALASVIPTDTTAREGEALFMNASCSTCHRISGTAANGQHGPDLTHFASRSTMLSGMMDNTPANVDKWLTDPQKVKPGAHMPRFIFSKDSVRAITAYLSQLK
jgi:cytochrome c oxidase subunit 2